MRIPDDSIQDQKLHKNKDSVLEIVSQQILQLWLEGGDLDEFIQSTNLPILESVLSDK